jgi:hypothetical protein
MVITVEEAICEFINVVGLIEENMIVGNVAGNLEG